jgi:DUF1365 family protein
MPRVLGHVFNPISIFFCYRTDGQLSAVFYEVHNTFGERHGYLIPASPDAGRSIQQDCEKEFHVSPFMDMRMSYRFRLKLPADDIRIGIVGRDEHGVLIVANQEAKRVELSDGALARVFFTHPLVTMKVVGGIHWEALRIWLKGIKVRSKPQAPAHFVTTVDPHVGR